jgi:hypothetical protein
VKGIVLGAVLGRCARAAQDRGADKSEGDGRPSMNVAATKHSGWHERILLGWLGRKTLGAILTRLQPAEK